MYGTLLGLETATGRLAVYIREFYWLAAEAGVLAEREVAGAVGHSPLGCVGATPIDVILSSLYNWIELRSRGSRGLFEASTVLFGCGAGNFRRRCGGIQNATSEKAVCAPVVNPQRHVSLQQLAVMILRSATMPPHFQRWNPRVSAARSRWPAVSGFNTNAQSQVGWRVAPCLGLFGLGARGSRISVSIGKESLGWTIPG